MTCRRGRCGQSCYCDMADAQANELIGDFKHRAVVREAQLEVLAAAKAQAEAWDEFQAQGGFKNKHNTTAPFVRWEMACRKTETAVRALLAAEAGQ